MPPMRPADGGIPCSSVLVDGRRVGVGRYGSAGEWPLVGDHGGLSCGLDATVMDDQMPSTGLPPMTPTRECR